MDRAAQCTSASRSICELRRIGNAEAICIELADQLRALSIVELDQRRPHGGPYLVAGLFRYHRFHRRNDRNLLEDCAGLVQRLLLSIGIDRLPRFVKSHDRRRCSVSPAARASFVCISRQYAYPLIRGAALHLRPMRLACRSSKPCSSTHLSAAEGVRRSFLRTLRAYAWLWPNKAREGLVRTTMSSRSSSAPAPAFFIRKFLC